MWFQKYGSGKTDEQTDRHYAQPGRETTTWLLCSHCRRSQRWCVASLYDDAKLLRLMLLARRWPGAYHHHRAYNFIIIHRSHQSVPMTLQNEQGKGTVITLTSRQTEVTAIVKMKKMKMAHSRLSSVGSGADPGSWQSACRWRES